MIPVSIRFWTYQNEFIDSSLTLSPRVSDLKRMMALRQANSAGSTTTTRKRVTSSPRKRKSVLTCCEVLLFVPPLFPPPLPHPKATTCGWLKWVTENSGLLSIGKQNWMAQMRNNSPQLSSSKMIYYYSNFFLINYMNHNNTLGRVYDEPGLERAVQRKRVNFWPIWQP